MFCDEDTATAAQIQREREDMVSVEFCLERVRGNKDKFKKLTFFSFVDSLTQFA